MNFFANKCVPLFNEAASVLRGATLHIDGKTLCGSQKGEIPGVHMVAAYSNTLGIALTQLAVNAKTNEHKAALRLSKLLPLQSALVSGDATFAQCDFSQAVLDGGEDYLLTVKENQPKLEQAILDAFAAPLSLCGDSGAHGELAHCHNV
jgi:hypothetical protein